MRIENEQWLDRYRRVTQTITPETERLGREIRAARNDLMNAITTRREHPTFGYTKKAIQHKHIRLMALCEAWLYVTGLWTGNAAVTWYVEPYEMVKRYLDIDLAAIEKAAERALAVRNA